MPKLKITILIVKGLLLYHQKI